MAYGEVIDARWSRNSAVPFSMTVQPGRNFSESSFGVDSVWINMLRLGTWVACHATDDDDTTLARGRVDAPAIQL